MKKMIWFTKPQLELLTKLAEKTGMNNAEIVREGMNLLADKLSIETK